MTPTIGTWYRISISRQHPGYTRSEPDFIGVPMQADYSIFAHPFLKVNLMASDKCLIVNVNWYDWTELTDEERVAFILEN